MKFESVRLTALDFHDKTFLIGSSDDYAGVLNSIKELGIINPPSLRRKGNGFQIVCGWKRIKVCEQLGYDEIPSSVYEMDELSDEDCLNFVFYENQQRFNDIDKAELISKFKFLCDLSDNDLVEKVLPAIGIRPTGKNLEKYMSWAGLEGDIKEAYYREAISLDQVVSLSEFEADQRLDILKGILMRFKCNNNETREMVRDLEMVSSRDRISIGKLIDLILSEIGLSGGKNEFRQSLKRLRYPNLTRVEEHYKNCLSSLSLPKDITVHNSPFFEGNDLEIRVRFATPERLSELLTYLSSVLDDGGIERLLNVVREGE